MGNSSPRAPSQGIVDAPGGVNMSKFELDATFMRAIGRGGFGLVTAMRLKQEPNKVFAVKCMNKCKVIVRGLVPSTMHELVILKNFSRQHLHIVNLHYAFQDQFNLYAVLDLCVGGSVAHALTRVPNKRFTPERARHYMAEIVIGIKFLHSERIVHRDIKPDNLLIDEDGRIRISDFNVSLRLPRPGRVGADMPHRDGWGTRGYRAPEVYVRKGAGHLSACDWWSAGATLYEMLCGALPYPIKEDEAPVDMLRRVYSGDFDKAALPQGDDQARDFCAGLLAFEPKDRLNDETASAHAYFGALDWSAVEKGQVPAPWIPKQTPVDPWSEQQPTASNPFAQRSLADYSQNFDATLDDKERYRMIESNLRMLGFGASGNEVHSSDEEFSENEPTAEQQRQFLRWTYNATVPHEHESEDEELLEDRMPQYATLIATSALQPDEMRKMVANASDETLRQLCFEMRTVHEAFISENFRHMAAELKAEDLHARLQALGRSAGGGEKAGDDY